MSIDIRKIKIQETWEASTWPILLAEYVEECVFEEFPQIVINKELYQRLESSNVLHVFGAFKENVLIGVLAIMVTPSTHYEMMVATTEMFFLLKEHRKTGIGMKLLQTAEDFAKTNKLGVLFVSAPFGQKLVSILERTEYKERARVFCKRFTYE